MKHFYCILVVLLVTICSCLARPQTTIDSQPDGLSGELDPSSSSSLASVSGNGWNKFFSNYEPAAQPRFSSPMERFQQEFLSRLAQQQNAIAGGSGLPWDPMYRMPEMKRQVRYRQCYFNPISCFKK